MTGSAWLVTGGAGYIGQHVVRVLLSAGYGVVVLDSLVTGDARLLPPDVALIVGRIEDPPALDQALAGRGVSGVIHLAALKSVEESVERPLEYCRVNVEGTRCVLEAMRRHGLSKIVFSSSSSVYGEISGLVAVTEDSPTAPVSPYGWSKLVSEWLIRDEAAVSGVSWLALRYFNVAGTASPELADRGARNLVPLAIRAVMAGRAPEVFGCDYQTPDGSCIRDYIHVSDLADAHLAALAHVEKTTVSGVYNVGTGRGASVLEVVAALERVSGRRAEPSIRPRRPGDPAAVVADASRIKRDLGWTARHGVDDIVGSAWRAATAAAPSPD